MPYICSNTTKEIRKAIKKEFPKMKFSVRTENNSTVSVALLESNVEVNKDHFGVNEYWFNKLDNQELVPVFEKVLTIINSHKKQRELVNDSDYGSVPNFYIDLSVGKWDKPYKQKQA